MVMENKALCDVIDTLLTQLLRDPTLCVTDMTKPEARALGLGEAGCLILYALVHVELEIS